MTQPLIDDRKTHDDLPPLYNSTLMEAFGFSEDDLEANRRGFVIRSQRAGVETEMKAEADGMWLIMTVLLGVTLLLAVIFNMNGLPMMPLLIGAAIMLLPFLWFSSRRQTRLRADAEKPKLARVQGQPRLRMRGRLEDAGDDFRLEIDDRSFPLSREGFRLISQFDLPPMRVYYLPNSNQLLSAEVLRRDDMEKLKNDELELAEDPGPEVLELPVEDEGRDQRRER